jgi:hypothetical protein
MSGRRALDRRPGPLPDITTDDDSVTFAFDLVESVDARLILRCDGYGEVYACIQPRPDRPPYRFTAGE